jgi:hypothetical protein
MMAHKLSPMGGSGYPATELACSQCEHIQGEVPQGEISRQVQHQATATRNIDGDRN